MSSQTHAHPIDICFPLGCQGALEGGGLRYEDQAGGAVAVVRLAMGVLLEAGVEFL